MLIMALTIIFLPRETPCILSLVNSIPSLKRLQKDIKKLLDIGIIEPSKSEWSSPLHLVPKGSNDWRLVGDYRALNKRTERDTYPLPFLQNFSAELGGKKIFSKIDLKDAFYQIKINPTDVPKTTITTPFGAYSYRRMNFGLSGASQTFQRFINSVLWDLYVESSDGSLVRPVTVFAYVDDLLVASNNEDEHMEDMDVLLKRLSD